ncbi:DUF2795 domain-containing protein [Leifsonia sp. NPDC058292]|uniref:DUF2795 domain-containing protein n=1 Tax=Leifsonia sp. NPDC058292 TaxID=3346428 RepID=UPI0036DE38E6
MTDEKETLMADRPIEFEVQRFLADVDYPASRDRLIAEAENEGATDEVLEALRAIPDGDYESPTRVSEQLAAND